MKVVYNKPKMHFELEIPPRLIVTIYALSAALFSPLPAHFIEVLRLVAARL